MKTNEKKKSGFHNLTKLTAVFLLALLVHGLSGSLLLSAARAKTTEYVFMKDYTNFEKLKQNWSQSNIIIYEIALQRFPDAGSCRSENSIRFDWEQFQSYAEIEICLSRIHSELGDPEEILDWFEKEGFSSYRQSYKLGSPARIYTSISGFWKVSSQNETTSRKSPLKYSAFWFDEFMAKSNLNIDIDIGPLGQIVDVHVGFSKK